MIHPRVLIYKLASTIHWPPRQRAVSALLDELPDLAAAGRYRVVDIGCGPGLLAPTAHRRGLRYLGLDIDPANLEYSRRRFTWPGVAFSDQPFDQVPLSPEDVVVMNGVVHHLPDEVFGRYLRHAATAAYLVICDHWRVPGGLSRLTGALQRWDLGKFVRDFETFEQLEGYSTVRQLRLASRLLGVTLWPYFCSLYRPAAVHHPRRV